MKRGKGASFPMSIPNRTQVGCVVIVCLALKNEEEACFPIKYGTSLCLVLRQIRKRTTLHEWDEKEKKKWRQGKGRLHWLAVVVVPSSPAFFSSRWSTTVETQLSEQIIQSKSELFWFDPPHLSVHSFLQRKLKSQPLGWTTRPLLCLLFCFPFPSFFSFLLFPHNSLTLLFPQHTQHGPR